MAIMVLSRPGPKMATMAMASSISGRASMTSMTRMTASSARPPRNPTTSPSDEPTARPIPTAITATRIETRAP
ncbi:MAG: hypothetical protein AVDCRST_MAG02-2709 [uncultured Rubrobacteraceae bacterium]|uniref:Uncharacterized protein n=1 Tax=uncultured Rubrobacteraceae bacterium TaxID=349277 RepID=A0A6J4R4D8_9ACTN|nr:MAG: hypothetical protein AVDCRST_MAG02-2709 [uncultured Rubrobacteraceae bacterium]